MSIRIPAMRYYWEGSEGSITISLGNRKVSSNVAIISFGSALMCQNQKVCPFHYSNTKRSILCYACKIELIRPSVAKSRQNQRFTIEKIAASPKRCKDVAKELVNSFKGFGVKYLRLNESGDIDRKNSAFAYALAEACKKAGIHVYLYTRTPWAVAPMQKRGAVVLFSGKDFIVVHSAKEAEIRGLPLCPAKGCGTTCTLCMDSKCPIAVKKH